jgi:predicted anti-sigma-YlaC factor YlaD
MPEPTCRDIQLLSGKQIDEELSSTELELLNKHLPLCPKCRQAHQTDSLWREAASFLDERERQAYEMIDEEAVERLHEKITASERRKQVLLPEMKESAPAAIALFFSLACIFYFFLSGDNPSSGIMMHLLHDMKEAFNQAAAGYLIRFGQTWLLLAALLAFVLNTLLFLPALRERN